MWCVLILAALATDDVVQPVLTRVGRQPQVRQVVRVWQRLAEPPAVAAFVAAVALASRRHLRKVVLSLTAVAAASPLCKFVFGRVRPRWSGDATIFQGPWGFVRDGVHAPFGSMPSGHTMAAFAMAALLSTMYPRGRAFWFGLATGVGFSRTLADAHFPSDVIAGAAVGLIVARWSLALTGPDPVRDSAFEGADRQDRRSPA